jgi:hypothetical protein
MPPRPKVRVIAAMMMVDVWARWSSIL